MKRWMILVPIVLLCYLRSSGQSGLGNALKAEYTFDLCDAADDTGNNPDGKWDGGCDCGASGESLYFNGKDDFVEFEGNINEYFKSNNFTISFYLKPNTTAPNTVLLSKYDCANDIGFLMRYGNGSVAVQLNAEDGVTNTLNVKLKDPTCWTHVALVRSGPAIELYENGRLIGKQDNGVRNTNISVAEKLRLGAGHCSSSINVPFRGNIDELKIYNQPLDELDIRRLLLTVDKIVTQDTVVALGTSFVPSMSHSCTSKVEWSPASAVSDPGSLRPQISVEETTVLTITYDYGHCKTEDQVEVRVVDSEDLDCETVLMPRAFTPNSDGLNDMYGITVPGAFDELVSFEIYNTWSELVFRTDDPRERWDGTFKGEKLNPGGFLYKIRYQCGGQEYVKTGEFLLLN